VAFHKLRPQLDPAAQQDIERQMGRMTRQMAAVTGPAFGYWTQPAPPGASWRECFASMIEGILADGVDMQVDLEQPYSQIVATLERHFEVLDEVRTPRLVHWDLWEGNVFVDPFTHQVTGLIDFERVMWADPLIETIFAFGHHQPDGAYVAGYGERLFVDPNQVRRRLLYNAYLYLILIIECPFRKYPNNHQETWGRKILKEVLAALC
jgi:fructosamine-3-kinase